MRGLALLVLLSVVPRPVLAQSEAAEAFASGSKLFEKLDYIGALERFEKAYLLAPHYAALCNIARCHERLGDMVRAEVFFERCLKEGAGDSTTAVEVEAARQRVKARISWVEVRSPGAGGMIYLDGKRVTEAPGRIAINPGTRTVEVRRSGHRPATTTIETRGGELRVVELVPTELPKALAVPAPKPEPSRRTLPSYWFWGGTAVTAALTVASVVMGVKSLKDRDDYEADPTHDGLDKAKSSRLTANVLIGTTLAAAGATTAVFFFTDFSGQHASKDLTALGVGLRGTF